jgi:TfoX/Sxy family transcriptional regulator of competence genes
VDRREDAHVEPASYRRVVEALLADGDVSEGQMMGMPALKAHGKMFGGCFEGRLVVKIGRDRVQELIDAGRADQFDPSGRDRPMKDWAQLSEHDEDWLALAREARARIDAPTDSA